MKKKLITQFKNGLIDHSLKWPSRWAEKKIWMPSPFEGPLTFKPFPWLPGLLDQMDGQVTVMKGSQVGCSVIAMIKALFAAIELHDEAMIVQPTTEAAGLFAQSRLDPIIEQSPAIAEAFPKNDSVKLKTTKYHSHIFLRGSISEAGLTSQPVSLAVIDEFDRCNINCLALVLKRMSARDIADRHVFVLSTPLIPDQGVDAQYTDGTQERFRFPCPGCSRHISLEWPDCIEICGDHPKDPDIWKSYYKCPKCGKELGFDERGVKQFHTIMTKPWLAEAKWTPDSTNPYHRSAYIPQMYGPRIRAGEIVKESMEAELSEPMKLQFINQTIGLPYIAEDARLNEKVINDCIGSHKLTDEPPVTGGRMIVMGVDTGSKLDCVITEYLYVRDPGFDPIINSIAKVLQVKRIPRSAEGWSQLDWLMREYSIEHAVIDFQPETTKAEEFAGRFYKGVSLNQYRKGTQGTDIKCKINENKIPILTTCRTSFMDVVFNRFFKGTIQLPVDIDYVFKEQLLSPIRTYEYDEFDRPKAMYTKATNSSDHLAHSLLLCEIAHLRAYVNRSGRVIGSDNSIRDF